MEETVETAETAETENPPVVVTKEIIKEVPTLPEGFDNFVQEVKGFMQGFDNKPGKPEVSLFAPVMFYGFK